MSKRTSVAEWVPPADGLTKETGLNQEGNLLKEYLIN